MPYVVFGVVMALVIAAATPVDRRTRRPGPPTRAPGSATPEEMAAADTAVAVGTFVWIAVVVIG